MESSIRITKDRLAGIVHFAIVTIAGMSTILRPSIESNITLFRVLLPFLFLWLFVANQRRALKLVGIIVIFISYSLLASYVSRFHTFNLVFNLYYITIFFFYFYYKEILRICGAHYIYSYLSFLFKTLVILGLIQYLFGGIYINTPETQAVNIFFWTENEFSAVLAIFVPLFFLKEKHFAKYLWIFGAVFLIVFNDAKLALLSLIVFFGGYFLIKFKLFRMRYLGFLVLGVLGIATLYFAREYSIQGKYTIEYFISRLAENIITQEPLEHIGTFNARSNAVILGIKELLNSYLLGIGPGNSDIMIDEIVVPGTEEYTALSMHNFTLQIVTEMGLFGFGMLAVFYMKVKQASEQSTYPMNLVFIFFISCIISITLLSGAWSNYFYLFILIYSIDFFKNNV